MQNDVLCTSKWKQVASRGKELLIQKAEQEGVKGAGKGVLWTYSGVLREDMK